MFDYAMFHIKEIEYAWKESSFSWNGVKNTIFLILISALYKYSNMLDKQASIIDTKMYCVWWEVDNLYL